MKQIANINKKNKILLFLGILVSIFVVSIIILGFTNSSNSETPIDSSSLEESIDKNENLNTEREESKEEEKPKVKETTGVIIGLDKSKGLTDVIMVARFDPVDGSIKFVSIPRDLYVNFQDPKFSSIKEENEDLNVSYCKLTELYHRIGDDIKAVKIIEEVAEKVVGIPIDYYFKVDLEGFKAIIDAVDGVEVDVPRKMDYDDYSQDLHIHLEKGLQVLDGDKAEQLVRYRHGYVDGDLGRIRMQQTLLKNLGKKIFEIKNPIKIFQVVQEGFKYLETDFTVMNGMNYIKYLSDANADTIFNQENMATIPTGGEKIDGLWYEIQDEEKTKEILDQLFEIQKTE